jgi:hypothetical protein
MRDFMIAVFWGVTFKYGTGRVYVKLHRKQGKLILDFYFF